MPKPNAEQPPPPPRGNVEKDAIGPGSEPMEPEEGLQGSSPKEPLSHGIGRQRRRAEEPASSGGRAPEPSWSWESWSRWDWQDDSWQGSHWKWSQASPDADWEDRYYNDSDRQADDAASMSTGMMSPQTPRFMAIADGTMSPATARSRLRSDPEARKSVMSL